ncbi:MHYT domain-containing protein [Catellatospora methionotrophica]|uniref:MHYT domain-containing protein n=1 Tax=Catellatospora methionotrophica TaxID=121620 RepID=UPI0033C46563
MADVHHFTHGLVTPGVAYALSILGSTLGLICTARMRTATTNKQRFWWIVLAAWALGGTAIWAMHFMAMLGFSVTGAQIRYDIARTAISALVAIVVVSLGLWIVGFGKPNVARIVIGGIFTGVGVAGMHYIGMFAMRLNGDVSYDTSLVAASVLIAVVAATVALWFTVVLSKPLAIAGAALLMGVAVCGMHYTGMAAMSVKLTTPTLGGATSGASAANLLVPIGVLVLLVIGGLVFAIGAAPTEEDMAARAYLDRVQAAREEAAAVAQQRGTVRRPTAFTPRGK